MFWIHWLTLQAEDNDYVILCTNWNYTEHKILPRVSSKRVSTLSGYLEVGSSSQACPRTKQQINERNKSNYAMNKKINVLYYTL